MHFGQYEEVPKSVAEEITIELRVRLQVRRKETWRRKIRSQQTARERGDHRSHRPRQDHADRRDHSDVGQNNPKVQVPELRSRSDNAPEEKARGITIAVAHVEYETKARTTLTSMPRPGRLHQEHDHRRGADGWRDPGVAANDGPCRRLASIFCWPARWACPTRGRADKVDMVDDPELLELSSSKCASC